MSTKPKNSKDNTPVNKQFKADNFDKEKETSHKEKQTASKKYNHTTGEQEILKKQKETD